MNPGVELANIRQIRLYFFAILVYAGIAGFLIMPTVQRMQTSQRVQTQLTQYLKQKQSHKAVTPVPLSGTPVSISIERLGINLPVAPGYYNVSTQKWTLDNHHVFTDNYTNTNPTVSEKQSKTTVIYGHDTPGVLVKTSELTHGDILTIDTQNGYQFRYYYDKSKVVPPNDTSVLREKNKGDSVILLTCTGAWYQSRRAMYFHLIDVQKISPHVAANKAHS
jgi:LPXTG-site transpeptidase (sortase) family protein